MLRTAAAGWILVSAFAVAQETSQPFQLDGVVVDQNGKPIRGVWLSHSGDRQPPTAHETDVNGRFSLRTHAPRIVFRKPGFESQVLATRSVDGLRITLIATMRPREFPSCPAVDPFEKPSKFRFKFPAVPEELEMRAGRRGFFHGGGQPFPPDSYVWQSMTYQEVIYGEGRMIVIDARGHLSNGNRWRFLGTANESAFYLDANEAVAKQLDRILDRACVQ